MDTRKFSQLRGLRPVKFNTAPIPTGETTRDIPNMVQTQGNFERYNSHRVSSRRIVATKVPTDQMFNINTKNGANAYPVIEHAFFNKRRGIAPISLDQQFNQRERKGEVTPWLPSTVRENVSIQTFSRDTRVEQRTNFKEQHGKK